MSNKLIYLSVPKIVGERSLSLAPNTRLVKMSTKLRKLILKIFLLAAFDLKKLPRKDPRGYFSLSV